MLLGRELLVYTLVTQLILLVGFNGTTVECCWVGAILELLVCTVDVKSGTRG